MWPNLVPLIKGVHWAPLFQVLRKTEKDRHTLFVNLTSRPLHYLQTQDGKTHTGLFLRGDVTLTPADVLFFARWQGTEHGLKDEGGLPFTTSTGYWIMLRPT